MRKQNAFCLTNCCLSYQYFSVWNVQVTWFCHFNPAVNELNQPNLSLPHLHHHQHLQWWFSGLRNKGCIKRWKLRNFAQNQVIRKRSWSEMSLNSEQSIYIRLNIFSLTYNNMMSRQILPVLSPLIFQTLFSIKFEDMVGTLIQLIIQTELT